MNPVNPNESELIRTYNPNQTAFFGIIRIDLDRPDSFELIGLAGFIRVDSDWPDLFGLKVGINSDYFGLTGFNRVDSDYKFGLILNEPRTDSD